MKTKEVRNEQVRDFQVSGDVQYSVLLIICLVCHGIDANKISDFSS